MPADGGRVCGPQGCLPARRRKASWGTMVSVKIAGCGLVQSRGGVAHATDGNRNRIPGSNSCRVHG